MRLYLCKSIIKSCGGKLCGYEKLVDGDAIGSTFEVEAPNNAFFSENGVVNINEINIE